MSILGVAKLLQGCGFKIFPVKQNGKLPAIKGWQEAATTDTAQADKWWEENPYYNVGISTTGLLVVDVDDKDGRNGSHSVINWEFEDKILPPTFTQRTPSGGRHLVYRTKVAVGNSVDLVPGVDIRGMGGLIVGAGSYIDGKRYTMDGAAVVDAPEWLVALATKTKERDEESQLEKFAETRAKRYLLENAPLAIQGEGGNHTTYTVAAKIKDFGVDQAAAVDLMLEYWNDRCSPPWSTAELSVVVGNAYSYGKDAPGSHAIENIFTPVDSEKIEVEDPIIRAFNREYAFVLAGGGHHILWETTDAKNKFKLEHLNEPSFHAQHASKVVSVGTKANGAPAIEKQTKVWMRHPDRRSYKGFVFRPGLACPPEYYNLWRGFSVPPLGKDEVADSVSQKALDDFLAHALENVCDGDTELFTWLIGYFAHLVQRPWEKPLVALVFRGAKGVGKNALVDRIGYLLGGHFMVTAKRRYLTSNFTGHLENLLLFTLDEAFWSGDKEAEGILKDLITGDTHVIEHKGKENYTVENRTRIIVIGNEDWLVPATHDERRFAVFNVGDGRKQDGDFFTQMRVGMEQGGYRALLRYLLDFDLSQVNVNKAPSTTGLRDQKIRSEAPVLKWWLECLEEGKIVNGPFGDAWPEKISKDALRDAYKVFHQAHRITARVPENRWFGRELAKCMGGLFHPGKMQDGDKRVNCYQMPNLKTARAEFEKYIGHEMEWENEI